MRTTLNGHVVGIKLSAGSERPHRPSGGATTAPQPPRAIREICRDTPIYSGSAIVAVARVKTGRPSACAVRVIVAV